MTWSACMCIAQSGCSITKYMCMYYPQESTVQWTAASIIAITERGGFLCNFAVDWTT